MKNLLGNNLLNGRMGRGGFNNSRVPGIVIDYSPAESGHYIGSPSIAVLPDGTYTASHDFFGPNTNHKKSGTTIVFSSKDRGETWEKIADITPLFWGKLFVHNENLFIFGTRCEYGDALIRRAEEGGQKWTEPNTAQMGLLRLGRFHCAPCRVLTRGGRIWRSIEYYTGGGWGNFEAQVMSAPLDADLLNANNWSFSQRLPNQKNFCWLEGNIAFDPEGKIVNILRANRSWQGGEEMAAIVHVSDDGQKLSFDPRKDVIKMPGGGAKFTIHYDRKTSRYWSIVNKQSNPKANRNNLALTSSPDLRSWKIESTLLWHPDSEKHAWQYIDWQFDGDDIIFVSRTAYDDGRGGAHSFHDANYLTFHRHEGFRSRRPKRQMGD